MCYQIKAHSALIQTLKRTQNYPHAEKNWRILLFRLKLYEEWVILARFISKISSLLSGLVL